jgi:hypothetical protein
MPVARQQIPNTHQLTNWEAVLYTRSVRQLRDITTKELLEAVFSMWFTPRLYHSTDRIQLVHCSGMERVYTRWLTKENCL